MGVGQLITNWNSVNTYYILDAEKIDLQLYTNIINIGQSCHEICQKSLKSASTCSGLPFQIFVIDNFNV